MTSLLTRPDLARTDAARQRPLVLVATLGGVSATVTATPTQVVWEPGDGSPAVTCTGPGEAYDPSAPDATSDCAHTYIRANSFAAHLRGDRRGGSTAAGGADSHGGGAYHGGAGP